MKAAINVDKPKSDTRSGKEHKETTKKKTNSHRRSLKEASAKQSHAVKNPRDQLSQDSRRSTISKGSSSESDSESNFPTKLRREGKRKAFIGRKEFKNRIKEEKFLSVKNILKQSTSGKCLLARYKKDKNLSPKFRKILVDLVISANIDDENSIIRHDEFDYLSDEIVELFPTESKASYFIPPVPKHLSRLNKSEVAKGKLVDKFRNKIKYYRQIAGVSRVKKSEKKNIATALRTEDVETSIQWLKHNRDAPFSEVLDHWERTSHYRWNNLKASNMSIADHIKEWSNLAKSDGYKLVEAEFRLLWKDQVSVIYTRWAGFCNKVRTLRRITNPNVSFLENIIDDETSTENCKILAQLQLLPYLVPPKGRIRNQKQHWKPSITECQESILIHVKEPGHINEAQRDKVDKMAKLGLTVQPYIIAVGATLQEVKEYYVTIDETLYKFDSPLKAFDVCFKSFHVLNALYPPESEHIYFLIQWGIYDFTTDWDKSISYIMDIVKSSNIVTDY